MNEQQGQEKLKLPENLYNEMLAFFRRTSLPRIQRQRAEECKIKELENTPSENSDRSI
jgi:hypothetical protein